MVEIADTAGLISGFRLHADGPIMPLPAQASEWATTAAADPVWLHFNLADARAQKWIAACPRIPAAARARLLDDDRHILLQPAGAGLAGVLADVHYDFDSDPERLEVLRVYVDETLIVTGRLHPLKIVDHLRREVLAGNVVPTPVRVLIHHIGELASLIGTVATAQGDMVDEIEDRLLKERFHREGAELGRVRRLVARLRRYISAERQALAHFAQRPPPWCGEVDAERLRFAVEQIEGVAQDLESIQERARLLQEEIAGRLGEATNRNLYVLSIVTVIFMPITLITGIFGMNVGGLPWLAHPVGFWWVIGVMAFTAAVSLALLHWRRFF